MWDTIASNFSKIKGFVPGLQQRLETDLGSFIGKNNKNGTRYTIQDVGLDIIGDETVTLENDVTDYYVETNAAFQDQISIKPITYTISGEVGELVYRKNDTDNSILSAVPEKLTAIASFIPPTTKKVNQIRNKVIKVSNFVNSIDNFVSRVSKLSEANDLQEMAYKRLFELRKNREPIAVVCPWGILDGYVITRLEFNQKEDSKDKTFITISFKEIKTTSISTVKFDAKKYQGIEKDYRSQIEEQGQNNGIEVPLNKVSWGTGRK